MRLIWSKAVGGLLWGFVLQRGGGSPLPDIENYVQDSCLSLLGKISSPLTQVRPELRRSSAAGLL